MRLKNSYFLILACLFTPIIVTAQSSGTINISTTAVPFLRISPDARAGGMGDAGIATSADANSVFWNVAKTTFAKNKSGVSVNYNPWLRAVAKDMNLSAISGYHQLDEKQALTASLRYFSLGDIKFTDATGNILPSFNPREFSFDVGYSKKLGNNLALGVALRYINSRLANDDNFKTGNAFAADISLYYNGQDNEGQGFSFGFNASNLGTKIGYTTNASQNDFLPANLGIGTVYTAVLDGSSKLNFALDVNKLLVPDAVDSASVVRNRGYGVVESWFKPNQAYSGSLGLEYAYADMLFLRTGYYFQSQNVGNRKYFTAGLGLNYDRYGLNFSYIIPAEIQNTINPLANTIRINLTFNLDKLTSKAVSQ